MPATKTIFFLRSVCWPKPSVEEQKKKAVAVQIVRQSGKRMLREKRFIVPLIRRAQAGSFWEKCLERHLVIEV